MPRPPRERTVNDEVLLNMGAGLASALNQIAVAGERFAVVSSYVLGIEAKDIAARFQVSLRRVYAILREEGVKLRSETSMDGDPNPAESPGQADPGRGCPPAP
jgi:hypothetical protein